MITAAALREHTQKDLAQMAKKRGVQGWHSMRKDELVKALVRSARAKAAKSSTVKANGKAKSTKTAKRTTSARNPVAKATSDGAVKSNGVKSNGKVSSRSNGVKSNGAKTNGVKSNGVKTNAVKRTKKATSNGALSNGKPKAKAKPKNTRATAKIQRIQAKRAMLRDLSTNHASDNGAPESKDRVVLMVRDPFWLHALWELSAQSIERAKAALAGYWHTARPVLRLLEVDTGTTTSTTECVVRDIEIHGGVNNWYIDVADPPSSYRVEIGYLTTTDRFVSLARSNSITTPRPGSGDAVDENWADVVANCEKIYAMSGGYSDDPSNGELQELFEERLRRPMGSPMVTRFGAGADPVRGEFKFEVDAEMIVHGTTNADAYVTLMGEPVKLRPDGSFTVRLDMPNRRQVIPAVAHSVDGVQKRTVVIAVERNTKVMEPQQRETDK